MTTEARKNTLTLVDALKTLIFEIATIWGVTADRGDANNDLRQGGNNAIVRFTMEKDKTWNQSSTTNRGGFWAIGNGQVAIWAGKNTALYALCETAKGVKRDNSAGSSYQHRYTTDYATITALLCEVRNANKATATKPAKNATKGDKKQGTKNATKPATKPAKNAKQGGIKA